MSGTNAPYKRILPRGAPLMQMTSHRGGMPQQYPAQLIGADGTTQTISPPMVSFSQPQQGGTSSAPPMRGRRAPSSVRKATNLACMLINFTLGTWVVIITIILILCQVDTRQNISDLKHTFKNFSNITDTFSDCCDLLPDTCICAPGLSVECWDANTNTPTVISGISPGKNVLYVVCTAGNTNIDNNTNWEVGDYLRYVEDEGSWFQNKASTGTGITMDTFAVNWTCALWPVSPIEANVSVFEFDTNWFYLFAEGVVQNSIGAGNCSIKSSEIPSAYQFNNTNPAVDRRINSGVGNITLITPIAISEKYPAIVDLSTIFEVYLPTQPMTTYTLDQFVAVGAGEPIGFYNFDRVYTTAPAEVTPFSPI